MIDLRRSSVLITGGSDGIGRGLAERFLAAGAMVLVTGRSREKLERAAQELPALRTFVNDVSNAAEREVLAKHVHDALPTLNILINNAGVQRRIALAADTAGWSERQQELDTLLCGPVHLNHLLVPLLVAQPVPSLVVNVSSGGAFVPQVFAPLYSACKAAIHSYTVTLRHALANTTCRVVELIPPRVQTSLGDAGASFGAPLADFCDSVFAEFASGVADEIGYGTTANISRASRQELDGHFQQSAARFDVQTYARKN
ncbi:MAG: SDR family NAD(P)-dependent oxidoreductase [Polyangiaceae bacterium]